MTQPPANDGYYTSGAWRTPAELDQRRWEWLQQAVPTLGRGVDEILNRLAALDERLDRIEAKLDAQVERPRPRRRLAREEPEPEQ